MKAKLTIDGKEFNVELSEKQIQDLTKKKTGYERVKQGGFYYTERSNGTSDSNREDKVGADDRWYECANYYSDRTIAENNARADKLYRQLRRFAVEHRSNCLDWSDDVEKKYIIYHEFSSNKIRSDYINTWHSFGELYFDSEETAQLAIETFKDDLLWYFTEYKDSL